MPNRSPNVVVITGAGSGIGRATAERFAKGGAKVVCADIDAETAAATADRITGDGGFAVSRRLDVADPDAWEQFAAWVRAEFGVPDVIVNNAGIGMGGDFLDHTVADWKRIVDINLLGVVYGARVFGKQLAERHAGDPQARGHIVNIASAAAFTPLRTLSAYNTVKAAVLMLSEATRAEMRRYNVGVSAICPGFIATNIYSATTFVGADNAGEKAAAAQSFLGSGRFTPGPDLVARKIQSAVRWNRPVVPVTVGAWASYALWHFAKPLTRLFARIGDEGVLNQLIKRTAAEKVKS
ncbi:SDR family NAD(P)-dependent oxidoreductase [Pseudonocardiaceae bacterium YIM PH 21723]|nr:SDR family NAD(P)-dependent oxidoreductase [Pseudonocardiaceae bacterium YIM PH 21723]